MTFGFLGHLILETMTVRKYHFVCQIAQLVEHPHVKQEVVDLKHSNANFQYFLKKILARQIIFLSPHFPTH